MKIQDLRDKVFNIMAVEEAEPPFPLNQIRKELNKCDHFIDFIQLLDEYGWDQQESIWILDSVILDK